MIETLIVWHFALENTSTSLININQACEVHVDLRGAYIFKKQIAENVCRLVYQGLGFLTT